MTTTLHTGAVLSHPSGDYMGNLLWPGVLPADQREALPAAIAAISAQGYWASPFPEGDGVAFQRYDETPYDPDAALADFQAAFGFLKLDVLDPDEGQGRALARLAGDRSISCICLVPVEGLRLEAPFDLGETRFHAPVDGTEIVADHVADRQAVAVLHQILTVDDSRSVRRHGRVGKLGRPTCDDKGAAMTVERQPPSPQIVEEVAEDGLPSGHRNHERRVGRGAEWYR
ncbi:MULTISPECIES: hypothetical protein [Sphingomonas]|uniref:Uncharacterized protein n=1 Tax=Sphingomonas molluscorum TaxID=418184 RepID=A0ABU8Q1P1_9SPHN|nr:hypothetical protein [Sphingomonas sp. JUb134]MBM7405077.1 hypothetical protein [Sphingomonas sp. JUb134]